jgi:hypothetical protein
MVDTKSKELCCMCKFEARLVLPQEFLMEANPQQKDTMPVREFMRNLKHANNLGLEPFQLDIMMK